MKSVLVTALAALLVLAGVNPVRADDDAAALLAKYRSFVGWSLGDGSISALRIKGRIADAATFDETCQASRFAQFSTGISSGRSFLVAGGIDGTAWVSHAGTARELPPTVAQDTIAQSLLLCNAFATYPGRIVAQVAGTRTNSRSGYALVTLAIPHEPAVILAINKDTGALTSVIIDGIASYQPADLKNIDGTRKIYTRWRRMVSDTESADMVISGLQLNVHVDPAIFSRTALDAPPPADPAASVTF